MTTGRRRPTLDDVSALAEVSRSTSSRVLNGHPSVRPEVRDRVRRAMDDLGYVPDRVARSLRRGRSGIVGLVIPQPPATVFGDAYFAALVSAVVRSGQEAGCTIATVLLDEPPIGAGVGGHEVDPSVPRMAGSGAVADADLVGRFAGGGLLDGVVVTASVDDDPLPRALADAGVPVVVIGEPTHPDIPSVDVDNEAGGRLGVEHLAARGRRRLAVVGGPTSNASARSRVHGAREAAGGRVAVIVEVTAPAFSVDAGDGVVHDLLNANPDLDLDGLVAGSDAIAVGAMRALARHGRSVPGDVAVVGFDDLGPALVTSPTLSTVRQPVAEVGRRALRAVLALVAGDDVDVGRQVLEVTLVGRASTDAS